MTAVYMGRLLRQIDQSDDPAWYEGFSNELRAESATGLQVQIDFCCDQAGKVLIDWAVEDQGEELDLGSVTFQSAGTIAADVQKYRAAMAPIYARFRVGR